MADFSKFRSSLGGFNRSDVVNYLESSSLEHQKQLRKLREESAALAADKEALTEKLTLSEARCQELQAECDELTKQMEQLMDEDASLQQQIESLAQEAASLAERAAQTEQAALDEDEVEEAAQASEESLAEKELAAYRRAEAMERSTALRAERMTGRMSALCEAFRERCQDSGDEINALCTDLISMLARLNEALNDACVIFDDTDEAFDQMQKDSVYDEV